jgi:anion-transporting  ArsA/GET3 family ATPase
LVVAVPEPDAIREAAFFADRLARDRMPLAGLVLNRTHVVAAPELSADDALAAAVALDQAGDATPTADVLRIHAALTQQVVRETEVTARFTAEHPDVAMVSVPAQPADVHDIDGLRDVGAAFAG